MMVAVQRNSYIGPAMNQDALLISFILPRPFGRQTRRELQVGINGCWLAGYLPTILMLIDDIIGWPDPAWWPLLADGEDSSLAWNKLASIKEAQGDMDDADDD